MRVLDARAPCLLCDDAPSTPLSMGLGASRGRRAQLQNQCSELAHSTTFACESPSGSSPPAPPSARASTRGSGWCGSVSVSLPVVAERATPPRRWRGAFARRVARQGRLTDSPDARWATRCAYATSVWTLTSCVAVSSFGDLRFGIESPWHVEGDLSLVARALGGARSGLGSLAPRTLRPRRLLVVHSINLHTWPPCARRTARTG